MRFDILSDLLLNPCFKITTCLADIDRITASTSKFMFQGKMSKIRSSYEKFIWILSEVKVNLILNFSIKNYLQVFGSLMYYCPNFCLYMVV